MRKHDLAVFAADVFFLRTDKIVIPLFRLIKGILRILCKAAKREGGSLPIGTELLQKIFSGSKKLCRSLLRLFAKTGKRLPQFFYLVPLIRDL